MKVPPIKEITLYISFYNLDLNLNYDFITRYCIIFGGSPQAELMFLLAVIFIPFFNYILPH